MASYDVFYDTVKSLKNSQGFYSRIWNNIQSINEDDLQVLKDRINTNYNFTDPVDVVIELEG